ncbi:hypothetical protein VRB12_17200 [Pseudomonas poae]|uniref:hypothetical protein n=1 Tax=Pseudomonas poae TaxID=200451 RepID=UPI0030CDDBFB
MDNRALTCAKPHGTGAAVKLTIFSPIKKAMFFIDLNFHCRQMAASERKQGKSDTRCNQCAQVAISRLYECGFLIRQPAQMLPKVQSRDFSNAVPVATLPHLAAHRYTDT